MFILSEQVAEEPPEPCDDNCDEHVTPWEEKLTVPVGDGAPVGSEILTVAVQLVLVETCTGEEQDTEVLVTSGCTVMVAANARAGIILPTTVNIMERAKTELIVLYEKTFFHLCKILLISYRA